MKESVHLCSNFFPGNGLDLTRVELSDAPFYFLGPRCFYVLVRLAMKSFQNPASQLRPIRFRKVPGFAKKLGYVTCHDRILAL